MAGLLGIGQSALMAAYAQLQTTGHNIANANTAGYSRQEAVLATAGGTYSGGGFLGNGVDLVTVQRSYDRFLTAELASSTAASASDTSRAAHLERLQRVLADTDNGIGAAVDDLNTALADVVNRASDPTARQVVVQRAETLARRIRDADSQMDALGRDADERIAHGVGRVNELLQQFAGLNERISAVRASGHTPNDLLDERDRVLMQLNEYLKVSAQAQDDGTVNLYASGGEGLLVGSRPATLKVEEVGAAGQGVRTIHLQIGATKLPMNAGSLGGGSIGGSIRFRDGDLEATRVDLAELAQKIADAYNEPQLRGLDANGRPGEKIFATGVQAGEFRSLLASGERLAAAYPVTAQVSSADAGVQVASFSVGATPGTIPLTIRFYPDTGTYSTDGGATKLPYVAGATIAHDGWSLTLRGTPKAGDEVTIVRNENPASDGRNARTMILASQSSGDVPGLTDRFAALVGDLGARTQSAQASRTASSGLLANAQASQAEQAAVNLDEEAARLMQYQQMYQAAAKVIQAAQAMFDSLLAATAR